MRSIVATVALLLVSASARTTTPEPLVRPTAIVAADNARASQVGVEILQAGGNAVDAAVAVGLALGVLNPFASGLGGGGFLVHRDAASGEVFALDFREMAPALAHRDMYIADGVVDGNASRYGGLAVAVPGEAAGWVAVHERFGVLPWETVVEPARALAADGFAVPPLLVSRLAGAAERTVAFADFTAHFSNDGTPLEEGAQFARPTLAATLEAYQSQRAAGFYEGWVADDLVAAISAAGGVLTHDDLRNYTVRWRDPVHSTYRGLDVYGMPGPSSGGLVVAQVLNTLEGFALTRASYEDAITRHIIMQAFAHAFADRARLLGDPDFWQVPQAQFLGEERTQEIMETYNPATTLTPVDYGPLIDGGEDHGTSHFSIVDANGGAVACTVTVNTSFGSLVLGPASGVVLNNEMDDFSAQPGVPNAFGLVGGEANAIQAGKRPLSSMSPTIVARGEHTIGVLGGSGGPMIITETLLGLVQMIDFDRDAATAVQSPRFHHQWLPFVAWTEQAEGADWSALDRFGYEVNTRPFGSALQIVWEHPDGWQAASDPRKHGAPAGY